VKRIRAHDEGGAPGVLSDAGQGLGWIEPFLETKTLWHPIGL
jgi:hypothetical protein